MKRFFNYFAAIAFGAMLAIACAPEDQPGGDKTGAGGNNDNTVAVTSVTLNVEALSLEVGGVSTLTATVKPDNATNKAVTWSSNTPAVATVDEYGLVMALAEGTAVITATAGECTAECTVTVTVPEVVVSPFSELVKKWDKLSDDVYAVELPIKEGYSFAGEFDFKNLFASLPEGATFALAPVSAQNFEVAEYYESLTGNLAAGGTWTRKARFAHDLNVGDDKSANGVRVLVSANGNTLYTINFYIVDPVVGLETVDQGNTGHVFLKTGWLVEFADLYGNYGSLEMELGAEETWETLSLKHGADNDLNLVALLNDITNFQNKYGSPYFADKDADRLLFANWHAFSVSGTNGEELFFNDTKGGKIALTDYGQALCTSSKGVFFQQQWSVCVACANWQLAEEERPFPNDGNAVAVNGKIDFVGPAEAEIFKQEVGIYLTADGHIKTTENYKGAGARISPQMHFEYDYGSVCVSPRYLGMFFVNRRWAAPGEVADVVYPYTDGKNE